MVFAALLALDQVLLDPEVLFDLALKYLSQVAGLGEQIILIGHHAHAHHVVGQGNVPEPAAFGNKGHGGGTGVNIGVAERTAIVGPDGHLVQRRIPLASIGLA